MITKAEEARRRAAAAKLAKDIGERVLNDLLVVACVNIRDYARVQPKQVLNMWAKEFGPR